MIVVRRSAVLARLRATDDERIVVRTGAATDSSPPPASPSPSSSLVPAVAIFSAIAIGLYFFAKSLA